MLSRYESVLSRKMLRARIFIRALCPIALLVPALCAPPASTQTETESPYYSRANTLGIFGAYSADSSHMLLGDAEHRMLLNIGVSYNRRLHVDKIVNWQYSGEILPVALESDPLTRQVNVATSPAPGTYITTGPEVAPMVTCSPVRKQLTTSPRRGSLFPQAWLPSPAPAAAGLSEKPSLQSEWQWNFFPRHKTQAFFEGHGGYMYSTQQIPVAQAGSFNFTLDLGAGFEVYRSKNRSIRAEYRYHHISNHGTAEFNPGIDNGLFQVTYCFRLGRVT